MAGREREITQSERLGTKRPWDDDRTLSGKGGTWNEPLLPPISSRPPLPHSGEVNHDQRPLYLREPTGPEPKRQKYVQNEYPPHPAESYGMNNQMPHSQVNHPVYDANHTTHGFFQSSRLASKQRVEGWENTGRGSGQHMESQDTSNLCRRCRRAIAGQPDMDLAETNDNCTSILRTTANDLTQVIGTLNQGISCDDRYRRGIPSLSPNRPKTAEEEFPPVEQCGLEHSLNWMLSRVRHISRIADRLVQEIPPDTFQRLKREHPQDSMRSHIGQADMMKRDVDADRDSSFRLRVDHSDPAYDDKGYPRETPSYTAQPSDGPHGRLSAMNPPVTSTRQLPSPPGRSISSPSSVNFPSPSAASFGSTSQQIQAPPPPGPRQTSPNLYLPPISSAGPSDSALQAHSAALQHDVSVQKIALSSLQAEHDKLLAAYLRSQTRASALEKKHSVSDAEIITLTEEKLRLQTQVLDLEKDVEDVSRSRDESRQSAVQESAQYLEIVKKASQLEAMATEEHKRWNISRRELELTVERLKCGNKDYLEPVESAQPAPDTVVDDTEKRMPANEPPDILKVEEPEVQQVEVSTAEPDAPDESKDSVKVLEEEIQHLRCRCAELEKALHTVREESRSMDGLIEALGRAGKSVLEHADKALEQRIED